MYAEREIVTRKMILPRLNDTLRFGRDFDVLKDLHVRGSGGAVPRLTAREAVDQCGNNARSRSFANGAEVTEHIATNFPPKRLARHRGRRGPNAAELNVRKPAARAQEDGRPSQLPSQK